jgi:hypothetical protein
VNPSGARRAVAGFGSLVFFIIAPGFVAGLVPFWISRWRFQPPWLGFAAFRVAGALLVVAGLAVLLESFWRFAVKGLGSPRPLRRRAGWSSPGCIATFAIPCISR